MGCTGSSSSLTNQQIILHLRKTKISLTHQQNKTKNQGTKLENQLIAQFKKDKLSRNKIIEQSLIQQVVYLYNKTTIFSITIQQITKVIDYSHFLSDPQKRQKLTYNIRRALYTASILGDNNLFKLEQIIKKRYKQIQDLKDDQMLQQIIRHHKHTVTVTDKMKNNYILQLCNQQGLALQKINQVGHSFKYGV